VLQRREAAQRLRSPRTRQGRPPAQLQELRESARAICPEAQVITEATIVGAAVAVVGLPTIFVLAALVAAYKRWKA
jgi:hypothetical protein